MKNCVSSSMSMKRRLVGLHFSQYSSDAGGRLKHSCSIVLSIISMAKSSTILSELTPSYALSARVLLFRTPMNGRSLTDSTTTLITRRSDSGGAESSSPRAPLSVTSKMISSVWPDRVLKSGSGRYVTLSRALLMLSNVPSIERNLFPTSSEQCPHPIVCGMSSPSICGEYTTPYQSVLKKPYRVSVDFSESPFAHCGLNWHPFPNLGYETPNCPL
mmetsp:Transcript_59799/g.140782  ORF Transcript_59799/g.140782 Transcript_59799/m.140782 type:complete len:216 (-) Transcript_59799:3604-4251(-)